MASKPGKKGGRPARAIEIDETSPMTELRPAVTRTILESGVVGGGIDGDYKELRAVDPADYEIGDELARGGMGRILEGRDRRVGRSVAIKEVLLELLEIYPEDEREELLRRFEREARITARLEHPAIVPVYEIGRLEGAPFFAMKKVDGLPLDKRIAEAPTLGERLALLPNISAVAEALGYAHDRGVIHRDLKPSNVLIGAHGETVVIDWGLAKQVDGDEDAEVSGSPILEDDGLKTVAGAIFGTPLYMPPEQARGEPVDRRADVYAIGSLLYHLLAGSPAYLSTAGKARRRSVLDELKAGPPQPLEELAPGLPPDLLSIVEKSMSRDRADRYPSAVELARDLRDFEAGQLVAVHDYSIGELIRRWLGRHRAAVATAAVALLTLIIVGGVLVQKLRMARDNAEISALAAHKSSDESTRLFTELGRAALLRDRLVEGTFALIQARLLGADVPGLDILLANIDATFDGLIKRFHVGRYQTYTRSMDGRRVIVADDAGAIHIYSTDDGRQVARLEVPDKVVSLAADSDGSVVATAARTGPARVWDVASGEQLAAHQCERDNQLPGYRPAIALTAGGSHLALGCTMEGVHVFAVETGAKAGFLEFPFPNMMVEFDSTSTKLLVSYSGLVIKVVELATGKVLADKQVGNHDAKLSLSKSYASAIVASDQGVDLFRFASGEQLHIDDDTDGITTAVLSPNGEFAVLAGRDGHLATLDTTSGKVTNRWRAHQSGVYALAISDDGERIASVAEDLVVRVWDTRTRRERASFLGVTGIGAIWFSRSGSRLIADDPDGLVLFDASGDAGTTVTLGSPDVPLWLAYSKERALRVASANRLWLRDPSGAIHALPDQGGPGAGLNVSSGAFSTDGARVAARAGIYSTASRELLVAATPSTRVARVIISADGSTMATLSSDGAIDIWDVDAKKRRYHLDGAPTNGIARELSLSQNGELFALSRAPRGVFFVATATGKETLQPLDGLTRMLASSDGRRLVTVADGNLVLWDARAGSRIAEVTSNVDAVAIADDASVIAAKDKNNWQLSLYSGDTGELLRRLQVGPAAPESELLAVNGGFVAATNDLGEIRLWEATSGLEVARRKVGGRPHAVVIAPDGSELAVSVFNDMTIFKIERSTRTPGELLVRLRSLYPEHFFVRNFLIGL